MIYGCATAAAAVSWPTFRMEKFWFVISHVKSTLISYETRAHDCNHNEFRCTIRPSCWICWLSLAVAHFQWHVAWRARARTSVCVNNSWTSNSLKLHGFYASTAMASAVNQPIPSPLTTFIFRSSSPPRNYRLFSPHYSLSAFYQLIASTNFSFVRFVWLSRVVEAQCTNEWFCVSNAIDIRTGTR